MQSLNAAPDILVSRYRAGYKSASTDVCEGGVTWNAIGKWSLILCMSNINTTVSHLQWLTWCI